MWLRTMSATKPTQKVIKKIVTGEIFFIFTIKQTFYSDDGRWRTRRSKKRDSRTKRYGKRLSKNKHEVGPPHRFHPKCLPTISPSPKILRKNSPLLLEVPIVRTRTSQTSPRTSVILNKNID